MQTYDGIFIINSALAVNQLTIYDNKTRFEQTLETLKSIDKHCPNNHKIIFDNSPIDVREEYLEVLNKYPRLTYIDMGGIDLVKKFSMEGKRSWAETYALMEFLKLAKSYNMKTKRIYKLSGRYVLTDNFVLDDPAYKDSFVFADALPSWLPLPHQNFAAVNKLYRLRLWHMDYSLLETFQKELPNIFYDVLAYGIDIEHAYFKNLHKYNHVEVPKIGVSGNLGPNGEFIDE